MQSRLLTQIDAQLARTRESVPWARLQSQRALYFARQGFRELAAEVIKDVRTRFAATPHAEVTAWVSLAEALNQFYAKPGPEGMDRMRRADALARAIGHPVLIPLCAAWLAHFEFNANRMDEMVRHAAVVLAQAKPDHHAAWARVSLVIADAFHHAGRFDMARPWYAKVREHAVAEGDDAMTSAMMHNVAAVRTNNARVASAFGLPPSIDAQMARLEANSTMNYDVGIGHISLKTLVPLVRAQLFTIQGEFGAGLELFDSVLLRQNEEDLPRRDACHHADRAWCLANLGRMDEARAAAVAAAGFIQPEYDVDDLACASARIASVYKLCGSLADFDHYHAEGQRYLAAHRANQSRLFALLDELMKTSTVVPRSR